MRKMYMEEGPDMSRIKEPRATTAVLIFAVIFMVGFGIWHAPLLEFASKAVPTFSNTFNIGLSKLTPVITTSGIANNPNHMLVPVH
jgi:hypothetical protein